MTEDRMSFLINIAMSHPSETVSSKKFRSYYLMRCQEVTGGYGLPNKLFSNNIRCPHCSLEWSNPLDVKEQTCAFCNHTTTTKSAKPAKEYPNLQPSKLVSNSTESKEEIKKLKKPHKNKKKTQAKNKNVILPKTNINVYKNASDVFSLKKNCNTLSSTVKETPKIIKNNKKRKDKFAGLCQKAVLASAKAKLDVGQKIQQNKLNLFLKPSSG